VTDAIYRVDGNRVVTSPNVAGPWDAGMQHGSAPAALVVWAAEAIPTREPMRIARVTIDLMRPVPVAPLTLQTEVLREGRKIQLCAVRLLADDVLVVGATVLKIKTQVLTLPPEVTGQPVELPGPDSAHEEQAAFSSSPFVTGISLRAARGPFGVPGPGAIWYRVDRPLVERLKGIAGHAGGGRSRFLQRHFRGAGFPAMDFHQRRPHRQFRAAAGLGVDFARCGILDRS
jgi:acyl-coenzyme A thioesterase PaaI-like protein